MNCVDLACDCTALAGFFPSSVFPLRYANAGAAMYSFSVFRSCFSNAFGISISFIGRLLNASILTPL